MASSKSRACSPSMVTVGSWPEIGAAAQIALVQDRAEAPRFLDGLVAVHVGDVVLADDDLRVDAGGVDRTEDLDDPPERRAGSASATA